LISRPRIAATRAFADRTKLETGYRGNLRTVDRDFVVLTDSLGAGDWIRNGRSNALDFDDLLFAALRLFAGRDS
jgi:superfamily I DNA/RNA helicase